MAGPADIAITTHDDCPREEAGIVDRGLDEWNFSAAPLHEVTPLSCFARLPTGEVIGGAVGRSWRQCCELQQLWVDAAHRKAGVGSRLVYAFEAHGRSRGCTVFYLETLSFQAPLFYESLGYRTTYEHAVYPDGIVRYTMVKHIGSR